MLFCYSDELNLTFKQAKQTKKKKNNQYEILNNLRLNFVIPLICYSELIKIFLN